MNDIPNTILDAGNLAEALGATDEHDATSDLETSHEPTPGGMSFHVKMNGYTLGDFEEMVIQTAAHLLLDSGASENRLKKLVEDRAIALITERCDRHLEGVTTDILNNPIMGGGKEPITIGDFIGIAGRDYLSTPVDSYGKPSTSTYNTGTPRIERIVAEVVGAKFEKDLRSGLSELTKELKAMAATKLDALIVDERQRVADALGFEIKKGR